MEEVTLLADPRRLLGSRPARRLRSQGQVPAVLYGHGVDPVALAVDGRQLRTALTGESGLNALINLEVEGTKHVAVGQPRRVEEVPEPVEGEEAEEGEAAAEGAAPAEDEGGAAGEAGEASTAESGSEG